MHLFRRQGCTVYSCTTFYLHVYLTERNMEATWRLGVLLCTVVQPFTSMSILQNWTWKPRGDRGAPCTVVQTFTSMSILQNGTWKPRGDFAYCVQLCNLLPPCLSYRTEHGSHVETLRTVYSCTIFHLHVSLTERNMEATWRLGVLLCTVVLFHLSNGQTRCFPFVGMLTHSKKLWKVKSVILM